MTPSPAKSKDTPWWMTILFREGPLVALAFVWVFSCAIPESTARREVLREIEVAMTSIVTYEASQADAAREMPRFAAETRATLEAQRVEHQTMQATLERMNRAGVTRGAFGPVAETKPNNGG